MNIGMVLAQAAGLMLTGMVIVFLFLLLLIVFVKLLAIWAGGSTSSDQSIQQNRSNSANSEPTSVHLAVISAAIARYRSERNTSKGAS